MRQKPGTRRAASEKIVKDIQRATRKQYSAEDQTLKNRILLENYFFPADLKTQIEAFVDHYNHQRYHESLNNVTPSDVYFGRAQAILNRRERIKRKNRTEDKRADLAGKHRTKTIPPETNGFRG